MHRNFKSVSIWGSRISKIYQTHDVDRIGELLRNSLEIGTSRMQTSCGH